MGVDAKRWQQLRHSLHGHLAGRSGADESHRNVQLGGSLVQVRIGHLLLGSQQTGQRPPRA
ncbi:hypothetical protein PSYPI_35120, partial [Pseudomonas syringae pv. pisi str. 1704B]